MISFTKSALLNDSNRDDKFSRSLLGCLYNDTSMETFSLKNKKHIEKLKIECSKQDIRILKKERLEAKIKVVDSIKT